MATSNSEESKATNSSQSPSTPHIALDLSPLAAVMEEKKYVDSPFPQKCEVDFDQFPKLKDLTSSDILISAVAKKRSYLILKPKRNLYLFKDGSFAYFAVSANEVELKAYYRPGLMYWAIAEGNKLTLDTIEKTYYFYFETPEEAQKWCDALKQRSLRKTTIRWVSQFKKFSLA